MKRLWLILPALLLLLAACAGQPDTQTTEPATETTAAPAGLYDPDSPVEAATGGAVKAYPLPADNFTGVFSMGSRLLLVADDGSMMALKGEDQQVAATMMTGTQVLGHDLGFDSEAQGVAYFLADSRQVVLVNPQLQETKRVELPEELIGDIAISMTRDEVYYCIPGEIRALNIQTGISRLIRSHSYEQLTLVDGHFDGTILECVNETPEQTHRMYFSAQTGQLLSEDEKLLALQTAGKTYIAEVLDGKIHSRVFGTLSTDPQCLLVEGTVKEALQMDGAVAYRADPDGLQLDLYHLTNGKHTASVKLPGVGDPVALMTTDSHVWVLASEGTKQVLFRWNVHQSPVDDEAVYTGPLYTADQPDTAGLDELQARVVEMNQEYGIRLHIWQDAVKTPGSHTLEPEHQVPVIREMLDGLEPVLKAFPEKFLQKTVEAGWIHVCLVRSVGNEAAYVQYWENGDCYIAICDDPVASFLQGAGLAVDSHVLGNSRDFDDWSQLNPEGFAYGIDDESAQRFLEGEQKAFVDRKSMEYPNVDRGRLFAAAMTEGNVELFSAPILQEKLLLLCRGIREAYGLEKSTETYLWEQYLAESIAYVKK